MVLHIETGEIIPSEIKAVTKADINAIQKNKQFIFKWNDEINGEVFKIQIKKSKEIVGLISIADFSQERWIKIRLLELSKPNVGRKKSYDNIAGVLIAYVCKLSFKRGYNGCVALIPKKQLLDHYIHKYNFSIGGIHLYIEGENSKVLIKQYLNEAI